jgi:hypothetical protein
MLGRNRWTTKSMMRLIALGFFCASTIGDLLPTQCYAQTSSVQARQMTADALQQRGRRLCRDIDATARGGFKVKPCPTPTTEGHIFVSATVGGGLLDLMGNAFVVDLAPRDPGDFSIVGALSAYYCVIFVVEFEDTGQHRCRDRTMRDKP